MMNRQLDRLWLLSVFLLSVDLFGLNNYLVLTTTVIGLGFALYKNSTFKITLEFILILFFSISYYFGRFYHGDIENSGQLITYLIGPVAMFLVGYCIVKENNNIIPNTILAIVFGNFTHGLLNLLMYFRTYGFITNIIGTRALPDIWTNSNLTATLQGTFFTLVSSLLFYAIFLNFTKIRKSLSFIISISITISLLGSVVMGNRTLIVILILTFILNFVLFNLFISKSRLESLKLNLLVPILLLTILIVYFTNLGGIKDFISGTTLLARGVNTSITDDIRWTVYSKIFKQIPRFPFGGYKMYLGGLNYAHNLWLDVLNAAGVIPFLLLFVFSVKNLMNLKKIILDPNENIEIKILTFSVNIGFLLNFMVEPILEGVPFMFIVYCLINGMISKRKNILNKDGFR